MKLTFHTDPGHGWVECPISLINELNIKNKISPYSYRRGDKAFLEEDCDAGLLIDALKAKGETVEIAEKNEPRNESFVRNLPSFY
jgi:hypothetical protein